MKLMTLVSQISNACYVYNSCLKVKLFIYVDSLRQLMLRIKARK